VPDSTAAADEVSRGPLEHRHTRGTALAFCSQAPIDKIERYRAARGWNFPRWSSSGRDFNVDFPVTLDPAPAPVMLKYRSAEEWEGPEVQPTSCGRTGPTSRPGDLRVVATCASWSPRPVGP
jgi:predicted dithiol-disulfide oxidoreductase (DUF899 family)